MCIANIGCQHSAKPKPHAILHQWPITSYAHNPALDLAHLYWWRQFNNLELNALMQRAVAQNNELQQSLTRIEQAQSQLEQIKWSWLPGIDYLGGYTQFPNLGNPGAIAIAYPTYIINILQLYKQQQSAKARYAASIQAHNGVKIALLAKTATSFFVLLQQMDALLLYQQVRADSQLLLEHLSTQYQAGLIAQDILVAQESTLRLIDSQIQLTQYNIVVSKNALHYLLAENPGNLLIKSRLKQLNTNAIIPGNRPLSVLQNRPDVNYAQLQLRAAHADTEAIEASFFPQINLGAYLGTTGNQGGIKLGQAYVEGPIVAFPLWAQIKGAKAHDKELYLRYQDTIQQALRDVTNDLAAYSAYSAQLENNKKALKETQLKCQLVRVRYQHGLENALAPLQCTLVVDELALKVNYNTLEKMLALVTLYQDLAGGYDGT